MVESEFILLGTERDSDGVPWALLASDRDGRLQFAGPAVLNPPQALRAAWRARMAALAVAKPPLQGLRQGTAQWLRPELRVRVKHLKAKGVLRHATVKQFITDWPPRLWAARVSLAFSASPLRVKGRDETPRGAALTFWRAYWGPIHPTTGFGS
jgi:hypothetical protein